MFSSFPFNTTWATGSVLCGVFVEVCIEIYQNTPAQLVSAKVFKDYINAGVCLWMDFIVILFMLSCIDSLTIGSLNYVNSDCYILYDYTSDFFLNYIVLFVPLQ